MKTFEDLVFTKNLYGLWNASMEAENGLIVSVVAGEGIYCFPKENLVWVDEYSSFEVAVIDKNGIFVTNRFDEDAEEVAGWQSRERITQLMLDVQQAK